MQPSAEFEQTFNRKPIFSINRTQAKRSLTLD
jgi:hypothetical protein